MSDISHNLHAVRERVALACRRHDRDPAEVQLIAVSKRHPAAAVRAAAAAGATHFGENYLQEARGKLAELTDLTACWHYIGALQANKTRPIAQLFDWVHTVERSKIARRLDDARAGHPPLNVCLQINVDADPNKGGVAPDDAEELLAACRDLSNLAVRGLMTILDPATDPEIGYRRLALLFHQLAPTAGANWDTLSMGMSGDYEAAIAAGATQLRIGTAIFGPRPPLDQETT